MNHRTVIMPFPLADGRTLKVEMPAEGLAAHDVERLVAAIRTWMIQADPQPDELAARRARAHPRGADD